MIRVSLKSYTHFRQENYESDSEASENERWCMIFFMSSTHKSFPKITLAITVFFSGKQFCVPCAPGEKWGRKPSDSRIFYFRRSTRRLSEGVNERLQLKRLARRFSRASLFMRATLQPMHSQRSFFFKSEGRGGQGDVQKKRGDPNRAKCGRICPWDGLRLCRNRRKCNRCFRRRYKPEWTRRDVLLNRVR